MRRTSKSIFPVNRKKIVFARLMHNTERSEIKGVATEAILMYNITLQWADTHVRDRGNGYFVALAGKWIVRRAEGCKKMLAQNEKQIVSAVGKRQKFLLGMSILCAAFAFTWLLCNVYYYRNYAVQLQKKADWVSAVVPHTRVEAELKRTSSVLLGVFTKHSWKINAMWTGIIFCSFLGFSVFMYGTYADRKTFLKIIGKLQE